MMDALIAGKLHARPEQRTGANGKPFATARLRAAAGDGEGDLLFVNCIAFDHAAMDALLALDAGDALSVAGSITPKVWTDRDGNTRPALDLVVTRVLTAYQVDRKRRAAPQADEAPPDC
ncbi:single-stranded DNA-binding protein [Pulveribacter suum]|uniref:Single-stranded DNA-binding protein n=1 Tax=Pulveribacter suum TaxID=2116657 RepID=A0A2P1NI50_9BURK|nr:single-stranded DNA-binding protein [Pulveribacter suum]AVP56733.1 single-stranded DNA-binding protein [Pulveribacter suum]